MATEPPSAELYVRSLQPEAAADRQAAVVDRLRRLNREGVLADATVTVWGAQFPHGGPTAETDAAVRFHGVLDRIRDWAEREAVGLESTFEVRLVERELDGTAYRATVLPTWCLVERRDGEIVSVTPHERGSTVYTVGDRLDQLAASADLSAETSDDDRSAIAD